MSEIRPIYTELLAPFRPGKYANASKAAVYLGASFVAFTMLALLAQLIVLATPPAARHDLVAIRADLTLIATLSAIVGAIVFIRDVLDVRSGGPQRREAQGLAAAQQSERESAALVQRDAAICGELHLIYQRHHDSLVQEARARLQPDRYGQRDSAAAAREFSYFQDTVAAPELARRGYFAMHIEEVFKAEREGLLLAELRKI